MSSNTAQEQQESDNESELPDDEGTSEPKPSRIIMCLRKLAALLPIGP